MSDIEIEDAVLLATFEADSKGRVNFGQKFANKKLKVCIAEVEDDEP